jgi:hypothetical protein
MTVPKVHVQLAVAVLRVGAIVVLLMARFPLDFVALNFPTHLSPGLLTPLTSFVGLISRLWRRRSIFYFLLG